MLINLYFKTYKNLVLIELILRELELIEEINYCY